MKEHDSEWPDEVEEGRHGQEDEPEPQEDVDLLVDDVDGKQTLETIKMTV